MIIGNEGPNPVHDEGNSDSRLTDALVAWNDMRSLSLDIATAVMKSQIRKCKRNFQQLLQDETEHNPHADTTTRRILRRLDDDYLTQDEDVGKDDDEEQQPSVPDSSTTQGGNTVCDSVETSEPNGEEPSQASRYVVAQQDLKRIRNMALLLSRINKAQVIFQNELEAMVLCDE